MVVFLEKYKFFKDYVFYKEVEKIYFSFREVIK